MTRLMSPEAKLDLVRDAAAELSGRLAAATPGPWHSTGPSSRYGGIVGPARPETDPDELEGYGGELIAESVLSPNGNLLVALSAAAPHVLALLLDVHREAESFGSGAGIADAELELARAIVDAPRVGWDRARRGLPPDIASALAAAVADPDDVVDAEIVETIELVGIGGGDADLPNVVEIDTTNDYLVGAFDGDVLVGLPAIGRIPAGRARRLAAWLAVLADVQDPDGPSFDEVLVAVRST